MDEGVVEYLTERPQVGLNFGRRDREGVHGVSAGEIGSFEQKCLT
jgi:hypothetical protein